MMMKTLGSKAECWYDFYEDFPLIEASITAQYGIRIRKEFDDISWKEVKNLIRGLGAETPLGNVVAIRSEKDKNVLKKFTPEQRRIRSEWLNKVAKDKEKDEKKLEMSMDFLQNAIKSMFS